MRQDLLEESAYDAARWQSMHESDQLNKLGIGTDAKLKANNLQRHMNEWLSLLAPHLDSQINDSPTRKASTTSLMDDHDLKELLKLMDVKKLAFMTITDTLRSAGNQASMMEGVKATRAIITLGRTVEDEFGAEAWKVLYPDLYDAAMSSPQQQQQLQPGGGGGGSTRAIRRFMMEQGIAVGAAKAASREGYGDEGDDIMQIEDRLEREAKLQARNRAIPWTQKMRAKVGGFLIKALLDVAVVKRSERDPATGERVEEVQPAFYQSYQFFRGNKIGVLKMNPVIQARLDKDSVGAAVFPRYLPMLVPPKPWTKWNSGGYRIHPSEYRRVFLPCESS